jgi:hypothetical protein
MDCRALLNRAFSHGGRARRQFFRSRNDVDGHGYGKMRVNAKVSNRFLTISLPA